MSSLSDPLQLNLRGTQVQLDTEIGRAFVADCARNIEGLLNNSELQSKWGISDDTWQALSHHQSLLQSISAELAFRVTSGTATYEAANHEFAKAPAILGQILSDKNISPRHRIDAARELRAVTVSQRDQSSVPDSIIININLGADSKLVYELKGSPLKTIGDGN